MLVLGIESSCDETACAVVADRRRVLSSVVASQNELHEEYGGVVPEIASRAHVERLTPVLRQALAEAGVGLADLDGVAVGHRPGLIGSLLVGVAAAKALAWSLGVPLVGVDHVHAHLYAGLLAPSEPKAEARVAPNPAAERRDASEPEAEARGGPAMPSVRQSLDTNLFPALGLVVSGGHTSIYSIGALPPPLPVAALGDGERAGVRGDQSFSHSVSSSSSSSAASSTTASAASPATAAARRSLHPMLTLRRLGATIDDAIGEAYDKAAAILGLGFPGGPAVDRLAQDPTANDRAFDLPISRLSPTSLDFSFSGLKTSLLYAAHGGPGVPESERPTMTPDRRRDLAASFQRAAVAAVILKLGRAIDQLTDAGTQIRSVITGGGVTANSRLRSELAAFAEARALRLVIPPMALCVDNAAMIAGLGNLLLESGVRDGLDLAPVPTTAC